MDTYEHLPTELLHFALLQGTVMATHGPCLMYAVVADPARERAVAHDGHAFAMLYYINIRTCATQ